jgi:SAM-dependent methyltransferase
VNSLDDSGAVFNYHRNMAVLHGEDSSLALGWRNSADQLIRFKALSGIGNLKGKTILDAGCGYADLLAYLFKKNSPAHYYGVEQIPELIEKARHQYGSLANTTFIESNFMTIDLPVADYVFASGSLNYRNTDPNYIFAAITNLFKHCKIGFAFNLLRQISGTGLIVAYDPEVILAHCRTLSNNVELIDGYADEDFTIYIYR